MSVNVAQLAATASSVAGVLLVAGTAFAWVARRHERRTLDIAEKAATAAAQETAKAAAEALTAATATITDRIEASDVETKKQIDELRRRSEEDRLEMAKQFGGNGGGMREAINKVAGSIVPVVAKVENLTGRFEQHLAEGTH
jgi:membrane-associated HD superfamily phosphohydrolase